MSYLIHIKVTIFEPLTFYTFLDYNIYIMSDFDNLYSIKFEVMYKKS